MCRAQQGRLESAGLSEYAQHVLQQICSQEWVLERCLQNPEDLCHAEMLLDNMLTPKQVGFAVELPWTKQKYINDVEVNSNNVIFKQFVQSHIITIWNKFHS